MQWLRVNKSLIDNLSAFTLSQNEISDAFIVWTTMESRTKCLIRHGREESARDGARERESTESVCEGSWAHCYKTFLQSNLEILVIS